MNRMFASTVFGAALALGGMIGSAQAGLTYIGTFGGNDCGGAGGFGNCYATQGGTRQGAPTDPAQKGSPTVYKLNSNNNAPTGSEDFGAFYASVDGSEFTITYDGATNVIDWVYTAGTNDPDLHYVVAKQANGFALLYDASPITSGSLDLDTYFPSNPGWSHITFFNSAGTGPGPGPIPEPATLALLGAGLLGLGLARRRRAA